MSLFLTGAKHGQQGYTYLWILFAVAFLGVGLASAGVVWHFAQQREKERELLFVGSAFRAAIARYYDGTPGAVKQYPRELADLIKDPRFPSIQRHLRTIYRDPITWKAEWGLVKTPTGEIIGVYSLSTEKPIKVSGFRAAEQSFAGKSSYADWRFVHVTVPAAGASQGSAPPPASGAIPGSAPPPASGANPGLTPAPPQSIPGNISK